tara:strand:- start:1191 stop:2054 length:864 start_codon:yes stop_codon:yes gene_type:complete
MVRNSQSNNKEIKKGLYLISTPIGNLSDITFRAINILKKSDYILCEDTRVSKNLLNKYEITSKLISNHKFNEKKNINKILSLLKDGLVISLISDAGTPAISDPGSILVNECVNNSIDVLPIPGPSSITTAMSISGFSEKFFFYGFFPEKKKILEEDLKNLSGLDACLVFFISSKKINRIIPFLKKNFSGRKILICKEMTKYYEEFIRSEIDKIDSLNLNLKGELTLIVSEIKKDKKTSQTLGESDKKIINKMINKLTIKEIVKLINKDKKISNKDVYNYCLKLKNEK